MMKQSTIYKLTLLLNEDKEFRSYEGIRVTFEANPGSYPSDIKSISKLKIPSDYSDLLAQHNGFTLYKYEDLGGLQFLGSDKIKAETQLQKETYEDEWDDRIIVICNVIADGDFIGLKIYENGGYELLDCYHDEEPQKWKVITDSLDDFLIKLIDSKGERYWLN